MVHKGYNNTILGREYNYGFNGKEEIDHIGLQWFDLGARNYSPELGRFMVMDPMTDFFHNQSPYVMANNNPVLYVDEYGMGVFNVLGNIFKRIFVGIGNLFRTGCSCKKYVDESIRDAYIRDDFYQRKKSNRNNRKRRPKKTTTATTSSNMPNMPQIDATIPITSLNLGVQDIPELGVVYPRPPVIQTSVVNTPPRESYPKREINKTPPAINYEFTIPFVHKTTYLQDRSSAVKILSDLIKTLKEYPNIKVVIEGSVEVEKKFRNGSLHKVIVGVNGGSGPAVADRRQSQCHYQYPKVRRGQSRTINQRKRSFG